MVRVRHPTRHDKDVARLPAEYGVADPGLALALDADIDRAVGRTIGLAGKTLRQKLDEGADRRHRRFAGCRVDVAQLVAVVGVGLAITAERVERLAALRIGIVE